MKNEIADQLKQLKGHPQQPLPSIRELAKQFGTSPLTMHRSLQKLAREKLIYALPRKGYFWGAKPLPIRKSELLASPSRKEEVRNQLLEDYKNGTLNPFDDLPLQKELCQRYKCSIITLKCVLHELQQDYIIHRTGRRWRFTNQRPHGARKKILVVVRCDGNGQLLIETDRELEFIRSCYQQISKRDFDVSFLGWDESCTPPRFLDPHGHVIDIEDTRFSFFGILVSTWLIQQNKSLLFRLRKKRVPLSVWWEHALNAKLIESHRESQIAYFNLAFGKSPGKIVAFHLLSKNIRNVIYLSPFHDSEWSRNRLAGIRQILIPRGIPLHNAVDSTYNNPWEIQQKVWRQFKRKHRNIPFESPMVIQKRDQIITKILDGLVGKNTSFPEGTAIIAVNDLVASLFFHRLDNTSTYLISFDNSSMSMRLQFASFAFNTDGMVRNMLHHVIQPKELPYPKDEFQEIEGWVEEKSNAFF